MKKIIINILICSILLFAVFSVPLKGKVLTVQKDYMAENSASSVKGQASSEELFIVRFLADLIARWFCGFDGSCDNFCDEYPENLTCKKSKNPPSDELTPDNVKKVVGYCNYDSSNNAMACRDAGITNKTVCYAYSQVGYKEKRSNKSLNSCKENSGSYNYQKYSGGYAEYGWCDAFVKWIVNKATGKSLESGGANSMLDKYKEDNKVIKCADAKPGDLVFYNGHVALYAGKSGNNHRIIHGNWNNSVVLSSLSGLDSLSGKTLKACVTLSGVTHD